MTHEWQTVPLGEVTQFINGLWKGEDPPFVQVGVIRNTNFTKDGALDDTDIAYLDVETKKFQKRRLQFGDLILEKSGGGPKQPVGRVVLFDKTEGDFSFSNFTAAIRVVDPTALDSRFLHKYLHWVYVSGRTESMQSHSTGIRNLNGDAYKAIEIAYPSLPEQRRIVAILDEAFEGITTAKANAEKNLQNARELFARQLQALFSEPRSSWVASTLGATYDVRDGTHDSPKYHDSGWPLITSKNLRPEGLSFDDVKLIADTDYRKINERSAVHKGDVLFAMIGTIGNPTVVEVEPDFAIKNVALFKIPKGQSGHYLRYYLSSQSVVSKMQLEAKGTTQKFVGLGYLRAFPVTVPPPVEQVALVRELDDLAAETGRLEGIYEQKRAALDELKKTLLHRAFTGALTEKSIDKQVAEIA